MTLYNEDWYQIVERLESANKHGLKGHPIIKAVSNLARRGNIRDLPILNLFIDDIIACLSYEKPKEGARQYPGVSSLFLTELITPWVKVIREDYFGSETPPFNTIEEVLNYYEQTISELELAEEDKGQRLGITSLLEVEGVRDYHRLLTRGILIPSILLPEEKLKQIPKSALLRERAEIISYATGLNSTSVMFHILIGSPPLLPQLEQKVHDDINRIPFNVKVVNRYATITLRNDVTFKELYLTYRKIRSELGTKRMKAFNQKHLELYLLVRNISQSHNRPQKEVAFWKAVQEEWNGKHPKDKYTTWKGVKIAYKRLVEKLNRLYLTGGTR